VDNGDGTFSIGKAGNRLLTSKAGSIERGFFNPIVIENIEPKPLLELLDYAH